MNDNAIEKRKRKRNKTLEIKFFFRLRAVWFLIIAEVKYLGPTVTSKSTEEGFKQFIFKNFLFFVKLGSDRLCLRVLWLTTYN